MSIGHRCSSAHEWVVKGGEIAVRKSSDWSALQDYME